MKKTLSLLLCAIIMISAFGGVLSAGTPALTAQAAVSGKISTKERNSFYHQSAFIGSSIGVGQKMYFDSKGKKYLGKPVMMVRGCYSFYNDKKKLKKWMITYKGKPMQAKNAVKKSKVKRVFIAMGTNDFRGNANVVYKDYVAYIKGIRKENPNVVIFIESTTSVTANKQKKYLNSKNIKKLNDMMKKYCKSQKNMYFVDVSSKMNDKKGNLKKKYASDGYCHLTPAAYKLWTSELTKYTDSLLLAEKSAKSAVQTAERTRNEWWYNRAKQLVGALESSAVKDGLVSRLSRVTPITTAAEPDEESSSEIPVSQ